MLSGLTSSPTIQATIDTVQPTSPPRPSRLRGLSYLRHYSNSRIDNSDSNEPSQAYTEARSWTRRITSAAAVASHDNSAAAVSSTEVRSISRQSDCTRRSTGASRASTGGWLPSVDGSSGPPRPTTQVQSSRVTSRRARRTSNHNTTDLGSAMTRNRAVTTPNLIVSQSSPIDVSTLRGTCTRRTSSAIPVPASPPIAGPSQPHLPVSQLPSIRLVPYQDPRTPRPSLNFQTTTRTLPNANSIVRVGRYSEKESAPLNGANDTISDAPIGFKSKVVSRRHCEFFYESNQWFIKDVESSSGTFLNHVRLSGPGQESKPFAIKDGDLVQLGIDFKGGEETIFRCVKIRILCNRGWQKSLNKFNKSAHRHLNDLQRNTSKGNIDAFASTECTICLNPVAPCQSLFVAPCSHTWHYKCIRPMLDEARRITTNETLFTCPNCRNVADLDADVDDLPMWDESDGVSDTDAAIREIDETHIEDGPAPTLLPSHSADLTTSMSEMIIQDETPPRPSLSARALNPGASNFVPTSSSSTPLPRPRIQTNSSENFKREAPSSVPSTSSEGTRSDTSSAVNASEGRVKAPLCPADPDVDGPLTPRNAAGPFVFDGGAGGAERAAVVTRGWGGSSGVVRRVSSSQENEVHD